MLLLGYLLAATALNLVLGFLVQFKAYAKSLRAVLLGLSALFTAHLWLRYTAVFSDAPVRCFHLHRWMMGLGLLGAVGMLELSRHFLRGGEDEPGLTWGRWRVSLFWLAAAAAAACGALLFVPGLTAWTDEGGARVFRFEDA